MAVQLDCPSCGASVKARRGVASATCKYCGNSVLVPAHIAGQFTGNDAVGMLGKSSGKAALVMVVVAVLLLAGIGVFVFFIVNSAQDKVAELAAGISLQGKPESEPILMEFGGTGTGPGYFHRPECIAIDGNGNLFVGEWETGRIQVFDSKGNFSHQWFFSENEDIHLSAMSCSVDGLLYLVYRGELFVHDGETGELLDSLQHPDRRGFSDVDVAPDGSILASWYCNRDDIIRFNCYGEADLIIEEAISGQTGDSELSTMVAAGNLGEIYAFGSFNEAVLIFNSEGRFQNRFGNGEMLTMPSGMAVDPLGRLWMSDFGDLLLFNSDGELQERIDPGRSIYDFVISDDLQLYGISTDDTVVQLDLSNY
ncbi:MAG: hypothetical protein KAR40_05380 [Candidatus Sabulitectum sp.]|nr:hypothetical protein [Candidatus Sabulitectum sp.]